MRSQPQSSQFHLAHVQSPFAGVFVQGCRTPALEAGAGEESARVGQQHIRAALDAYLFLSLLSPLCEFLTGVSVRCTGVQSHCGLKRISDDRKYVNLLFPSG